MVFELDFMATPPCEINQDQPTSHDFAKTSHESSHGFSKHPWLVEHTMPKAYKVFGDMVWRIFFLMPLAFCIFLCWGARPREARPTFLWRFLASRKTKMSEHVLEIFLINFARGWNPSARPVFLSLLATWSILVLFTPKQPCWHSPHQLL